MKYYIWYLVIKAGTESIDVYRQLQKLYPTLFIMLLRAFLLETIYDVNLASACKSKISTALFVYRLI